MELPVSTISPKGVNAMEHRKTSASTINGKGSDAMEQKYIVEKTKSLEWAIRVMGGKSEVLALSSDQVESVWALLGVKHLWDLARACHRVGRRKALGSDRVLVTDAVEAVRLVAESERVAA